MEKTYKILKLLIWVLAFAVVIERGGGGLAQAGTAANAILQTASEMYGQ